MSDFDKRDITLGVGIDEGGSWGTVTEPNRVEVQIRTECPGAIDEWREHAKVQLLTRLRCY